MQFSIFYLSLLSSNHLGAARYQDQATHLDPVGPQGIFFLCFEQYERKWGRSFVFVHSAEDRRLNFSKVI